MKSEFYRAFTIVESKRKGVEVDPETLKAHRVPIIYEGEDVAFEGNATDGVAAFDAGDTVVTRVVFYKRGKDDEGETIETVQGSVDVNASGSINVTCPEPEPIPDPTEIV